MCHIYNPICDVESALGHVGGAVANSVFSDVAHAFADAAAKVTSWIWSAISSTTRVDLSGGWWRSTLGITTSIAGLAILAIFTLQLITGVLKREPSALGRAFVGAGAGVLGAAASIGVVQALLTATDALSDGIVHTAGLSSISALGNRIAPASAIAGTAEPALIIVLGLGYIIASFFVWALFIARKAMIIVAAVFAPVAFAGAPSRATAGWVRRWIEFTIAMIFSKLVVVIIFTLALSLVGTPGSGLAAVGNLFSGLAMMIIACFAPWMLLKLVHFIGGDVVAAHHQGLHQTVVAAGSTPVAVARAGASRVAGVVGGGARGAGAAAAPPPGAPASTVPTGKAVTSNPVSTPSKRFGAQPAGSPAPSPNSGPPSGDPTP